MPSSTQSAVIITKHLFHFVHVIIIIIIIIFHFPVVHSRSMCEEAKAESCER